MTAPSAAEHHGVGRTAVGAAMAVAASVAIIQTTFNAVLYARPDGFGIGWDWGVFLFSLSSASSLQVALLVAGAFAITGCSSDSPRRSEITTVQAVVILGVIVCALSVLGIEELFRQGFTLISQGGMGEPDPDTLMSVVAKVAGVLSYVPSLIVAGTSAVAARRWLASVPSGRP